MSEIAEPLRFRIEPTEADWRAASWLLLRHRWSLQRLVLGFLGLWIFYAALLIGLDTYNHGWNRERALGSLLEGAQYGAFVWLFIVVLVIAFLPRRVRKSLAEARRLGSGADMAIDAQGLRLTTAIAEVTLAWPQFRRWHENAKVMSLAVSERDALLLPKAQIDPAIIDAVRNHLIAAQVERGIT
ncbi:YcxB family protein [Erythrobacter sp. NE805]|uniref:YcxB family protein n=1 Tax=Erythrobacter sp. NE805 TaxID=3389875 RepID=UPI00396B1DB0